MSNIPKMGHLPTPVIIWKKNLPKTAPNGLGFPRRSHFAQKPPHELGRDQNPARYKSPGKHSDSNSWENKMSRMFFNIFPRIYCNTSCCRFSGPQMPWTMGDVMLATLLWFQDCNAYKLTVWPRCHKCHESCHKLSQVVTSCHKLSQVVTTKYPWAIQLSSTYLPTYLLNILTGK